MSTATEPGPPAMEKRRRRNHRRFRLEVPLLLTWKNSDGKWIRIRGSSRNISAEGGFIVSNESVPPINTLVRLEAILPEAGPGSALKLKGVGWVLRAEPFAGALHSHGFAVRMKNLVVRPAVGWLRQPGRGSL